MGRLSEWFNGSGRGLRAEGIWTPEYRQSSLADGPQWLIDALGGSKTYAGERISVDGALAISDVFSAVSIVCENISQLPLKVFRDLTLSPSNPGTGIVEANDYRTYRMLHDMPNPFTPAHRFWPTVAAHQLLWGNWILEKLRDADGLVNELRLCDPASTEIQWDWRSGRKRYRIQRPDGSVETLDDDRVLHGFGFSVDGIVGLSPIAQARQMLGTARARNRFEGEIYGNRPYISGVVQHPNTIKDGGVKLRESWRAVYGAGSPDRHGVAVLEEGATFVPITAPLEDMQFVEAARLSKTEIATLFKLPAAYLGGSTGDSLTYQTVESNKLQLLTQAVAPVANNIAQFLSHDFGLFPFQSWYAEFVMEGALRGDSQARANYWKTLSEVLPLEPEYIAQRENIPLSAIKEPEPVPAQLQGESSPNGQPTEPVPMITG